VSRLAYAVDDVRAAEHKLMGTLPDGALMQRAASGLAAACADLLGGARGGVYGARVLVLAGSGANGGDALYAAARLARRGAAVDALLLSGDKVHPGALADLRAAGGRVVDHVASADLVLDGIVGIGGSGGLRPDAAEVWHRVRSLDATVVAVDVPSGIGVDDGTVDGAHVDADVTVTFGAYKVGLLAGPGARAAGAVHLVDIGLAEYLHRPALRALTAGDVAAVLAEVAPGPGDHKYTRGVVGMATGSAEFTGAGVLATAGASCGLAGMVRYDGPREVADLVRARHPEVVVGTGRVQCWVVGSGGGGDARAVLDRARADGVPLVVDADALQHATEPLGVPALLTPHAGELAQVLGIERSAVEAEPLRVAREAARRLQAVVLLKGDRTLVTDGDRNYVNTTGAPWLGTAGAGDVLAGLCGALLAATADSEMDLVQVGAVAAWLHGAAATLAGAGGPVVAGDVAAALPRVLRELTA